MTDISIEVNTRDLKLGTLETTTDFTIKFDVPVVLGGIENNVRLSSVQTWNSLKNFTLAYQNTLFQFDDGSSTTSFYIPPGIYNFAEFKAYFDARMTALGHVEKITFDADYNTGRIGLIITDVNYSIDLTLATEQQFGFKAWTTDTNKSAQTTYSVSTDSIYPPTWNNGVDSLKLTCDLVSNSYVNGVSKSVLASFTPRTAAFGSIDYQPFNAPQFQCKKSVIEKIHFSITDQSGRVVDFGGDHSSFTIIISPFRK